MDTFREFVFKTKGPTHTMVSSKRSVHIAPEVVNSAEAFVDMFLTEQRMRQVIGHSPPISHGRADIPPQGWEEVCRKGNTEEDATRDLQKIGMHMRHLGRTRGQTKLLFFRCFCRLGL